MRDGLRRVLSGTRALESRLATAFEKAAHTVIGPGGAQPLEIVVQAVDEIARHVQPSGRGRHAFPFNDIAITFAAPSGEMQAGLDAVLAGPPSLRDRVVGRLASEGCGAVDVDVRVSFESAADSSWARPEFRVALARLDPGDRAPGAPALRIDLFVTHGIADRGAYSFAALPIAIGRGIEVRDSRQRLLRINHVAFTDGADEATQSVSRRHARIELDRATGRLRLIDDNSAQGTSVIRNGRSIAVPRGSRGVGLQTGDEIALGQARMEVRIGT